TVGRDADLARRTRRGRRLRVDGAGAAVHVELLERVALRGVGPAAVGAVHPHVPARSVETGAVLHATLATRGGEDVGPGRVVGRGLDLVRGRARRVPGQLDPADVVHRAEVHVDPLWVFARRAGPARGRLAV